MAYKMSNIDQLITLEAFLQGHPTIKYIPPSSPEYATARKPFNGACLDNPLAVVQPQSPSDVAALVKHAKLNKLPFTIRVGGHNLEGRCVVQDALLIDLRALTMVTVASDRKSATVQGGILQNELANELWEYGLATPTGEIPSIGYVGWATYGGYGPFSSHWGLGVDQIIGATVVDPNGDIVKADEALLEGIRGAGGSCGVIIDLTIKVYPLASVSIRNRVIDFLGTDYHSLYTSSLPDRSYSTRQILSRLASTSTQHMSISSIPRICPHSSPSNRSVSTAPLADPLAYCSRGAVPTSRKVNDGARKSLVSARSW